MPPIDSSLGGSGYTVQPIVAMQSIPVGTWSQRAAIAAYGTGRGLAFFTDVGENGTLMQWNGTRWRALNGEAVLKFMAADSSAINNTETIVLQTLIPAGLLQTNDRIRLAGLTFTKSGATDTGRVTVRWGTAGTVAGDTAITGLSTQGVMAAANTSAGNDYDIKVLSATSAKKIGNMSNNASGFGGSASSTAAAADTTSLADASANAVYLSVSISSSGATDTVKLTGGAIKLITP